MKKGILFTLDSIFACLIALLILSFILNNIEETSNQNYQDMMSIGSDFISILKYENELSNIIKTNNETKYQNLTSLLPDQICSRLTIYDENYIMRKTIIQSGCIKGIEQLTIKSSFISNKNEYIAEMELWYD